MRPSQTDHGYQDFCVPRASEFLIDLNLKLLPARSRWTDSHVIGLEYKLIRSLCCGLCRVQVNAVFR